MNKSFWRFFYFLFLISLDALFFFSSISVWFLWDAILQFFSSSFFSILCFHKVQSVQSMHYDEALFQIITGKFSRYAPPLNLKDSLIKIFIDIYKILANDEKEGTITLKIEAFYVYESDDAKWNPDEHQGLKTFETLPGVFLKPFFSWAMRVFL